MIKNFKLYFSFFGNFSFLILFLIFKILRETRDLLLNQSDWTRMDDNQLSSDKKAEWAIYRQALRDLPANTADPANPTYPTKPS